MIATIQLPPIAAVVEAALEGGVLANIALMEMGLVPPWLDPDVRYRLEDPGQEDWKLIHNIIRDGWADCEDIAMAYAAGLRWTGLDEGARVRVMVVDVGKLHAVVEMSDGEIVDYCLDHGMNDHGGITESESPDGA